MPKGIFYTYAYNAEKTIKRTIQSVLAQTHEDFLYYVVDNGSTDHTGAVIQTMAQQDQRVIPLHNQINMVWEEGNGWWSVVRKAEIDDLFCFLDADDTYKPDYLEKMLAFMQENRLDIAACGNDFVDSLTGKITNVRKLSSNLIVAGQGFSYYFPLYHQFMRTMWAKAYRASVLQHFDFSHAPALQYGWDTLFAVENFRNASRIGILSESLHQYYLSKHSLSYQYDTNRLRSPEILYHYVERFLQEKCSQVSPRNQDFLLCIYLNDLSDALHVLWNTPIPETEKIAYLLVLFESEPLHLLLQANHLGKLYGLLPHIQEQRCRFFSDITDRMLSLDEVPDELVECFCKFGELLCASIEDAEKWMCFRNLHIQYLYSVGRTQEAVELQ